MREGPVHATHMKGQSLLQGQGFSSSTKAAVGEREQRKHVRLEKKGTQI